MPILPKDNHCCGCSACFSACPHDSITMAQDFCGFYYPKVDPSTCTECKLCEIACPTLPYLDFAPYDRVRKKSRFPYDVKSHSLDSRGIYVHFSWHKPSFHSKSLESSALDSRVNCHALQSKSRNNKKLESKSLDSRQTCSRLDLSDKDGALQGESRAHTWSCATTATPQQSPFLALKPTRSSFTPPPPRFA
ncbi:ferredoxin family protein [Helicobacter sp.]|uniref:4Fe-4S dicluster domain-containing protein n=1 Tax=Helicobacter sp. TaxID=218 RepID=UPI0025C52825|nr:ferredoxin family protein [Helicobacter sp.]MBR2494048.1 ferredoxin family protein [Helicobacter sp.]